MLPIIDLNPNDMSCVYSMLFFIEKEAKKLNIPTACVTFDQPLWLKAVDIVHSAKMNIVCRLGGFHCIMSFLGSVGHIMDGSGLVEALQCCYGPVATSHMMTGKAVVRAIRGHFSVESALFSFLMELVTNPMADGNAASLDQDDINELKIVCSEIMNLNMTLNEEQLPRCLQKLNLVISNCKMALIKENRTARLWFQYMDHIGILKLFITAERTADWHLHLFALTKMLNLFGACGHNNYAKSARLYLQLMQELPRTNVWVYDSQ